MGVASELEEPGVYTMTVAGEKCFYCGATMGRERGIVWMGAPHTILLHGECAINLCLRISSDVHKLQILEHSRRRSSPASTHPTASGLQ
jgi:hypothetical protein